MAKIIKIDGEMVQIGTDDGGIKSARLSDINFFPNIGDEVEVYESNEKVIVTKKIPSEISNNNNINNSNNNVGGTTPPSVGMSTNNNVNSNFNANAPIAMNNNQQVNNYSAGNTGNSKGNIALYIALIASIVACFLPIISVTFLGQTYSVNYVYNEGEFADGIFIVGLQVAAIILLSFKLKKTIFVLEILASALFGFTIYNTYSKFSQAALSGSIFNYLGIGFYVLLATLVVSAILAFLNIKKNS